jgi:hypothetical protein
MLVIRHFGIACLGGFASRGLRKCEVCNTIIILYMRVSEELCFKCEF